MEKRNPIGIGEMKKRTESKRERGLSHEVSQAI
jgi:hypothetical protein